jgi:hypothetical protein
MPKATRDTPATHETSDVEDIQLLRSQIVKLLYDPRFNDMTWREVEAALEFVMVDVRAVTAQYGSFNDAPPPALEGA